MAKKKKAPAPQVEMPTFEMKPRKISLLGRLFSKLNPLNLVIPRREPTFRPWFKAEPLTAVILGKTLNKYAVADHAEVFIVEEKDGRGRYLIKEPSLSSGERDSLGEQEIYSKLMEHFFYALKPLAAKIGDPMKYIEGAVWEAAYDLGLLEEVRAGFSKYRYYLAKDGFGFGKIHVPVCDPRVEEISCTGYGKPVTVIHRDYTEYGWLDTNITFQSEEELRNFNQRLAMRTGKSLTTAVPIVESTTREGDRISLTFGDEITHPGSSFDIRKFPREPMSLAHLVKLRTLSALMGAYLWETFELRGSGLSCFGEIIGPTGSGKTTLLNAVIATVPHSFKIATIEDTLELQLPHPNWLRLHTRTGYSPTTTRYDIDLMGLVTLSMRHRPDYIVVGEIRGKEIKALTHAALLGHSCVSTFHAESPEAALTRMRKLEVKEDELMLMWWFTMIHRIRMPNGKMARRVTAIYEMTSKQNEINLSRIFRRNPVTDDFSPERPSEVVKLSARLRNAARTHGMTERELTDSLERKTRLLRALVKEDRVGFDQFSEEIIKFYRSG